MCVGKNKAIGMCARVDSKSTHVTEGSSRECNKTISPKLGGGPEGKLKERSREHRFAAT